MELDGILTIIAIIVSPVIAVGVTVFYQNRKEKIERQNYIFMVLFSTRHKVIGNEEAVKALNAIDMVFSDSPNVRQKWKEYYEVIHNPSLVALYVPKFEELLKAIANEIGYKKEITHQDLQRVYVPKWMIPSEPSVAPGITNDIERELPLD